MRSLFISTGYLDVRAGRAALALKDHGIEAEGLCFRWPPQLRDAYTHLTVDPLMDWRDIQRFVKASKADVIHIHGELYGYWLAQCVREATDRPVILDCHDLACARPNSLLDAYEQRAFQMADAFVWVTQEQRDFGLKMGLAALGKPEVFVTNYVTSSAFIDKPLLPKIGGVVYAGGISKRGDGSQERDLSAVADQIPLHIYCGSPEPPDYGINHPQEVHYPLYIQQLARYDWGFCGHPFQATSWLQSMPTKATEYFAAGIPGIFMNVPACREFAERGMGVYIDDIRDLKKVASLDPKPYRKAVMAQRREFTVERIIDPLVELYRGLS